MTTIRTATGGGDAPPPDRAETIIVREVSKTVRELVEWLKELEDIAPAALDGYVGELAEELACVTVEWVRRGPRR